MFMWVIGVVMLAVGLWEIYMALKTFKQLKTGQLTTKNGFMPWALWVSLVIGILLALSSTVCFMVALHS